MRLLFVTQVVDQQDAVLGSIHGWLQAFASQYESIEVICLYEGTHALPDNVHVHSLGKEGGQQPSFVYALRFLRLAWSLRSQYDLVFVHMNQEYLLLSGWLWKLIGKRMYLWRNHYAGSWLTDLAASFCTKVFYTSKYSYTAKYSKAVRMPVGVDTQRFTTNGVRTPHSILFLARMAPAKHPDLLLDALHLLHKKGITFSASFYGDPLPEHEDYYHSLKEKTEQLELSESVRFYPGVPNAETPVLYRAYELFINCSPSGMYDKTIFEAIAGGCLVLAASEDFQEAVGEQGGFTDAQSLADRLAKIGAEGTEDLRQRQQALLGENTLAALIKRLVVEIGA